MWLSEPLPLQSLRCQHRQSITVIYMNISHLPFEKLPYDVLLQIFSLLSYRDVLSLRQVIIRPCGSLPQNLIVVDMPLARTGV